MNQFVELAKNTIEAYIKEKEIVKLPSPLSLEMKGKAGVFVSIKKHGELRGCIGTYVPTTSNIAEEIIRNAIAAATSDPRFPPISKDELSDLDISIDVLTEPTPVNGVEELDAKRYGVIVKSGTRRGLLLPDLDGVETPEAQISICKRKAGIPQNENVELYRFEVKRHQN